MEIIGLLILIQYMYLIITYIIPNPFLDREKVLTKRKVKTYFIPIIGILFVIKDWYQSLEE